MIATAGVAVASTGFPGTLDPTFGGTGIVTLTGGPSGVDVGEAIAVGPDGAVTFAGTRGGLTLNGNNGSNWVVARRLADGSVDPAFGSGGEVELFGDWGSDRVHDVAVDASGRTVAVGVATVQTVVGGRKGNAVSYAQNLTVARLLADGSLDTSFGVGGIARYAVSGAIGTRASALAFQPDGKIVVAGYSTDDNTAKKKPGLTHFSLNNTTVVARFTTGGTLDATFGSGGVVLHDVRLADIGDERPWMGGLGLQSDGGIVVGLTSPNTTVSGAPRTMITRYTSAGAVDTVFGTVTRTDADLRGLVVDLSDRVLVTAADATDGAVVCRYAAGGASDATFGVAGKAVLGFDGAARGACVQADGRVLMSCYVIPLVGDLECFPARLMDDGSLDASFGTSGIGDVVTFPGEDAYNVFAGPALAPDGRFVTAGTHVPSSPLMGWWIARYDTN